MKSTLEIGIIQQSKTGDIADNRRRLAEAVGQLAAKGAKLIVNQELHGIRAPFDASRLRLLW